MFKSERTLIQIKHPRISLFIYLADPPDNYGRHFSLAFMTNGGNRGGYLKLFLASHEDAVVHVVAEPVNIDQVLVIPGWCNDRGCRRCCCYGRHRYFNAMLFQPTYILLKNVALTFRCGQAPL